MLAGATGGIGSSAAAVLAERGAHLVLSGRRVVELRALAASCSARGVQVSSIDGDLQTPETSERIVAAAKSMGDVEPVVVNCAGFGEFVPFHETSPESLSRQIGVNLLGPALLCRAALPWMLETGRGQILNVLSIAATHALASAAAYGAAKAGLLMLSRDLALEYRNRGIRVSSLLPGAVDTPMWEGADWKPPREDMLPAEAVAEAIRDVVFAPRDRSFDEVLLLPPKGIL